MRKSLYLAAALLCAPAFSSPGFARGSDELPVLVDEENRSRSRVLMEPFSDRLDLLLLLFKHHELGIQRVQGWDS